MTAETISDKSQSKSSVIMIEQNDLPLSCPRPEQSLWNLHPRVYIPLDDNGHGHCPYCGNQFQLASK